MKSILFVENDLALRHTLYLILCRAGYLVETATDLRRALPLLSPKLYDLLLIDFHPADFDLADLLVEIRQRDSNIPILLLTSRNHLHDSESGVASLTKPVDPELVLSTVQNQIG